MRKVLVTESYLSDIADAIRTKSGGGTTYKPSEMAQGILDIPAGGSGSGWQRPEEWPNYDLLNLKNTKEESIYFTYDNRIKGAWLSVIAVGNYTVQRVNINNDGTVSVLSSQNVNQGTVYGAVIPNDAGDWVSYRIIPQSGKHLTIVGMNDGTGDASGAGRGFSLQPCVERYGYLPNLTQTDYGYQYRGWSVASVQSDTLILENAPITSIGSLANAWSLENFSIDRDYINASNFSGCYLRDISNLRIAPNVTNLAVFSRCMAEVVDFSDVTMTSKPTTLSNALDGNNSTRVFKLPKADYSSLTVLNQTFRNATRIEVIDLPDTLTLTIPANFTQSARNCRAVVIRANQVLPLANVNGIDTQILAKGGARVFVPQALIEDYKVATNWATRYESYPDMFGAIEGSEFEE